MLLGGEIWVLQFLFVGWFVLFLGKWGWIVLQYSNFLTFRISCLSQSGPLSVIKLALGVSSWFTNQLKKGNWPHHWISSQTLWAWKTWINLSLWKGIGEYYLNSPCRLLPTLPWGGTVLLSSCWERLWQMGQKPHSEYTGIQLQAVLHFSRRSWA